tara:strand:+ start:97 stop:525 length:429 start_codon:yes stop_codon:yes gene_type:complete
MSDNKIKQLRETIDEQQKKIEELEEFNYSLEGERLNEIIELEAKVKGYRENNDELCYEIDEINRKWAEDNERNGDICSEQQEQIIRLEEENRMLKDCDIMQYSYLVQGENKLLKEWQDMKNELGWMKEHIEVLEKQLDSKYD